MAKVFNNLDKTKTGEGNRVLKGWDNTRQFDGNRIANISDTIGAGLALEKLGTSIPSPFARILLFKAAFEQTNALGHDADNLYTRLVSECLDFLEFIYLNANRITVKDWNVQSELNALKNSRHTGHRNLGVSLEKFARDLKVRDIYLFYCDGQLIGGSSPYTLVYTSPNWQREKRVSNAKGLAGNALFQDYSSEFVKPVPLSRRDEMFRRFLTNYIIAFRNVERFAKSPLREYIFRNQDTYDRAMHDYYIQNTGSQPYDTATFTSDYSTLKTETDSIIDIFGDGGSNTLYIGAQNMGSTISGGNVEVPEIVGNDYKIKSTVNRSGESRLPLVLTEAGVAPGKYINGLPWDNRTVIVRNPSEALADRILPGGQNIKYPYLTDADLLEDTLIQMPYEIDSASFVTLGAPRGYLLPLKPRFFEYFNISDINDGDLRFSMKEVGNKVVVELQIPIQCKEFPYVTMRKEYTEDEIARVKPRPGFGLAVFPSYRLESGNVPNIFTVMVHDSSNGSELKTGFWKFTDKAVVPVEAVSEKERIRQSSKYIDIEDDFELITLEWEGKKATVIPGFKNVVPSANGDNTTVGIDFGTSNTYVSISYSKGASPETLEIGSEDSQVLTLNKIDVSRGLNSEQYMDSFSGMMSFNNSFDREFVPLRLGKEGRTGFPFRTVTCEVKGYEDSLKPRLFSHINIGLNFLNETVNDDTARYVSNIKWDITRPSGNLIAKKNRVQAFCEEISFIVKNKIMLGKHPSSKFTVYLTFPHTMSRSLKREIEKYWQDAFDRVMGAGNVSIQRMTESIAPYYFMVGSGVSFTSNAMNIDIGGGTTDMLFADVENKRFWYDSSLFAGNDIWGDGKPLVEAPGGFANGFITKFESLLNAKNLQVSQARFDGYYLYKDLVEKSEDLMSYVFRYEKEFRFTDYIRRNNGLMSVLATHLSALIYHVAQVLKNKRMTIPTNIFFSGMGSKYIQIIADSEDVTFLVGELLKEFTGQPLPKRFKVQFQATPKEVTAKGAMLKDHSSLQAISDYQSDSLRVYGFEEAGEDAADITYADAPRYKEKALKTFDKFCEDFFGNQKLMKMFRDEFDIKFPADFRDTLDEHTETSFDVMTREGDPADTIEETLFFWTLKNGLYEATKKYVAD